MTIILLYHIDDYATLKMTGIKNGLFFKKQLKIYFLNFRYLQFYKVCFALKSEFI